MTKRQDKKAASNALASAKKSSKKTSKNEVIEGYAETVDAVVRTKFLADSTKEAFRVCEEELIEIAREKYLEGAKAGSFSKSLVFAGEEFESVTVSFSDKFSALPEECAETVIESYVEDLGMTPEAAQVAFEQTFEEVRSIKLASTDDETIAILAHLLEAAELMADGDEDEIDISDLAKKVRSAQKRGGKVAFGDVFEATVSLVPRKGMDENQFKQPDSVASLLRQSKPSCRLKTKVATRAAGEHAIESVKGMLLEELE